MTKIDWEKLQLKFWFDHNQTGISAKGWCNKYQLNYATARRYIKVRAVKESIISQVESNPIVKTRKAPKRRGPPYGSQNALKHGGYSKYFYNDFEQRMEATSENDRLLLCRTRIHNVIFKIIQIQKHLEKQPSVQITLKLYDALFFADLAIDKNIARIEAVTKKVSSRNLDNLKGYLKEMI
ncbi:hypothetical protein H4J57_05570 [Colwellia sp. BRX8-7]|jgi:uncharacterized protein YjcR|uniref:hypothetical protein n=1 Tax=Colwellia sp. BRX8-7 TaxID=2759833 RepID=UPI0015F645F7|nr:hypothetical protein [Colwellia sp. BRX8-7]MBA6336668.1 hypothetical protein [Colwellia sp. BRX8-7]